MHAKDKWVEEDSTQPIVCGHTKLSWRIFVSTRIHSELCECVRDSARFSHFFGVKCVLYASTFCAIAFSRAFHLARVSIGTNGVRGVGEIPNTKWARCHLGPSKQCFIFIKCSSFFFQISVCLLACQVSGLLYVFFSFASPASVFIIFLQSFSNGAHTLLSFPFTNFESLHTCAFFTGSKQWATLNIPVRWRAKQLDEHRLDIHLNTFNERMLT